MLTITIPAVSDGWDPVRHEFIQTKEITLQMEHSLLSLSKWESKWKKPFMSDDGRTYEETLDYFKCMTLTQNVPDDTYRAIKPDVISKILDYIQDPMTATTINHFQTKKGKKEIVTSEIIYFWMTQYSIPFIPCEKWHLNRLMTLIEVCAIKNSNEKMSRRDTLEYQRSLNAARRAKFAKKH